MSSIRAIALMFGLLAAAVLLMQAAPATAHEALSVVTPVPVAATAAAPEPASPIGATPVAPASTPAPEPAAPTPWIVAGALALGGLALRRGPRRAPRRDIVVGLVLLLALFVFEDALHSVHHGFDPKQAETGTIAAASAHVSGVAVDAVVAAPVVLVPVGEAVEPGLSPLPLHRLAPDQGRAPPALPA